MDRISSFGSHSYSLSQMMGSQKRLHEFQTQVATGKRSQSYTGIAADSNRLINMETEISTAKSFLDRNAVVATQLKAMQQSMQSTDVALRRFLKDLDTFATADTKDAGTVESIQTQALQTMMDLESFLNVSVDGQYLFAGGKSSTKPVDIGVSNLASFQAIYDGMNIDYPTTRSAQLQDLTVPPSVSGGVRFAADGTMTSQNANGFANINEGSRITISGSASNNNTYTVVDKLSNSALKLSRLSSEVSTPVAPITFTFKGVPAAGQDMVIQDGATGAITFDPVGDTITAANGGAFGGLPVGTIFTVAGSTVGNDKTYQIAANDGTTITIESVKVVAEGVAPAWVNATITSDAGWYQGDTMVQQRRVDTDRVIDTGVLATDSAFEKAMRGLSLIAQGIFGTAGGLESNLDRIDQARYLLREAVDSPVSGSPPFGTELAGDLTTLQSKTGWNQAVIDQKREKHQLFLAFLEARSSDIENIDRTEASTYLLNESDALQASFAATAKIRQLTLMDYLS